MVLPVRTIAAATAVLLASSAFADRLFLIPTGKKILTDTFRLEIVTEPTRDGTMGWFGTGLGHSFDFEVTGESFDDNRMVNSVDFSYNFTVPVMDFVPGISFGVQDLLDATDRRRNLYVAITHRFGNTGAQNQDIPTEFTFGFWTRSEGAVFAGISLPFSKWLTFVAEHDSVNLTGGFELSPVSGSSFRFMFREDQVLVGLSVQSRF